MKERPDVGVYVRDLHQFSVKNAEDMDKIMTVGIPLNLDILVVWGGVDWYGVCGEKWVGVVQDLGGVVYWRRGRLVWCRVS